MVLSFFCCECFFRDKTVCDGEVEKSNKEIIDHIKNQGRKDIETTFVKNLPGFNPDAGPSVTL